MLYRVSHTAFSAQSRCINEIELAVFIVDSSVDSIAGGACNIADDRSVLTRNCVNKGRFSDIRLTDNGNIYSIFLFFLAELGNILENRIKQIACAAAVYRRNGDWITEPEIIKLIEIGGQIAYLIAFIYAKHYRFAALLQHCSYLLVGSNYT